MKLKWSIELQHLKSGPIAPFVNILDPPYHEWWGLGWNAKGVTIVNYNQKRKSAYFGHILSNKKYSFLQFILEGKIKEKRGIGRKQSSWPGTLKTGRTWNQSRVLAIPSGAGRDSNMWSPRSSDWIGIWRRRLLSLIVAVLFA